MARFNLPSANAVGSITVSKLGGVDLWSSPNNVAAHRSPSCVNMIRDKSGSVRKRMGYERITPTPLDKRVNGACFFANKHYVHSGQFLYSIDENQEIKTLCGDIADRKSVFIPSLEKLFFITGEKIYYITLDGKCCCILDEAYVPTVIVSKTPSGGGTYLEDYNLLSHSWKEQFLSDGESVVYHLEKKNISSVVSVEIRDENGEMQKVASDSYTVSLADGTITFSTAPKKPSVVGMDNVFITASKEENNEDMLFGCTVGAVFGAGGKNDRLFLGGNPKYGGMDFFSASDNFTYFPHMNYSKLSRGQIKGYSVFNGSLYTHLTADHSTGMSFIVKRDGKENENGSDIFVITDEFSSPGFVSAHTSLVLNGEALFLSPLGIYGITISDVTDEKVCQLRSAYFGKSFSEFTKIELENAYAVVFGEFYMLSLGEKMFVLDGEEKSYFEGTPLCSFQYECYYWENIPARIIWTDGKRLFFGDSAGNIYRFFNDKTANSSYVDDGKKVVCYFDTWDMDDRTFFKKKTYVSVSVKIGAFLNTGIKIYARTDGHWHESPVYNSMGRGRYMDFSLVDFESISFSSNRSEVTLCGKIRIRNTDSVRFRLMNDKAEPFALFAFGTEYVQKGNYIH